MTARVGLTGWPLGHSVSPAMHNAAFETLGLDWRYDPLPCPPADLAACIEGWLADGLRGFNVTIPHKAAVLRLPQVSEVSPDCEAIGAANTFTRLPDGSLRATNTDWQGFLADLAAHGIEAAGARCLLLGTGGSAQAVAYGLRQAGAERVTFVSRQPAGRAGVVGYGALRGMAADLVVNCTPVGMHPHPDTSPWPEDVPLPPDAAVVDLIYNPPETRLLARARAAGQPALGGLGMLVRQGALSFEQWTGIAPPLDVMFTAAREALAAFNRTGN